MRSQASGNAAVSLSQQSVPSADAHHLASECVSYGKEPLGVEPGQIRCVTVLRRLVIISKATDVVVADKLVGSVAPKPTCERIASALQE
jgi:hypothetical protein